ncbi:MAG: heavy-metal-associated domain-containing protein [Deltaproteobacteria bacterium]|nr:heavy-metal-associated domain-containing protein [Deltaproteobacteria bacterium]
MTNSQEQLASIQIGIQGMSCSSCAAKIEKKLNTLPGVKKAVVNFATHTAFIDGKTSLTEINNIIKALGYEVVSDQEIKPTDNKQTALSLTEKLQIEEKKSLRF